MNGAAAPAVAPRWEWRTFSRRALFERVASVVTGPMEPQSDETYILSARSTHNVKIRNHTVEVKHLDLVSPGGLELWRPTLKKQFPLPARALVALYAAWGIEMPEPHAPCWSETLLLEQIVKPHRELITVPVVKRRTRIAVGACRGEHVELTIQGEHWESIALEDPDEAVVHTAVDALALGAFPNTSYPVALARIAGGTATG